MEMSPDNGLMMEVKNGDLDKLGSLFEKYRHPLYRYFHLKTGGCDDCEDLVQNVFVRILKYRDRYQPHGEFKSWMFSIAHNLSIDYMRRKGRAGNETELLDTHAVSDPGAEEELIKGERLAKLEKALSMLREDYREALVLSRYENMKYKEIGEITGCSEGAVKVRIHRALIELKRLYDGSERP